MVVVLIVVMLAGVAVVSVLAVMLVVRGSFGGKVELVLGDFFDVVGREPAVLAVAESIPPARVELGEDLDQFFAFKGERGWFFRVERVKSTDDHEWFCLVLIFSLVLVELLLLFWCLLLRLLCLLLPCVPVLILQRGRGGGGGGGGGLLLCRLGIHPYFSFFLSNTNGSLNVCVRVYR
jgi:hypothetical protein